MENKKKRQKTEQEMLFTLTAMCASAEHCSYEMRTYMNKWEMPEEVQERILSYLIKEQYIDDERYCRSFVKDKIRYNKWGERKISQALYMKQIPQELRRKVLADVDDNDYLSVLRPLLKNKGKTIKTDNRYERNGKLIRFALSRGFTMNLIRQCVDDEGFEDLDNEDDEL
ncbi:MAG: RecX family transcriptional regulator [Prevotella sp.]|jgi:regulatory protein|nr:RecX family transcriptional regulator [Prevotella sp.]